MAIDKEQTRDNLFGNIKKEKQVILERPSITPSLVIDQPADLADGKTLAKWQTLDRVTVFLSQQQKEELDRIAKKIMKYRAKAGFGKKERERITANTLIRALVDALFEKEKNNAEIPVIDKEEDAKAWILKLFQS